MTINTEKIVNKERCGQGHILHTQKTAAKSLDPVPRCGGVLYPLLFPRCGGISPCVHPCPGPQMWMYLLPSTGTQIWRSKLPLLVPKCRGTGPHVPRTGSLMVRDCSSYVRVLVPTCQGTVWNHMYSGNDFNTLCSLARRGREYRGGGERQSERGRERERVTERERELETEGESQKDRDRDEDIEREVERKGER